MLSQHLLTHLSISGKFYLCRVRINTLGFSALAVHQSPERVCVCLFMCPYVSVCICLCVCLYVLCVCVRVGVCVLGEGLKKSLLPGLHTWTFRFSRSGVRSDGPYLHKTLQVILHHSQDLSSTHTQMLTDSQHTTPFHSSSVPWLLQVLFARRALAHPCLCLANSHSFRIQSIAHHWRPQPRCPPHA